MPTQPASPGAPFPAVPEVIFANWREALHRSGLSPGLRTVYTLALNGYLEYCDRNGLSRCLSGLAVRGKAGLALQFGGCCGATCL